MAPIWRRQSTASDDNAGAAREAARQAALLRRDISMQVRAHLATLYPSYPHLTIRSQQSVGAGGQPCYIASVLYENVQSSRLSRQNPVIGYDQGYYDDRLLEPGDVGRFVVLLNGTPGADQTEGMHRLLERVEVLVRSGWRSEG